MKRRLSKTEAQQNIDSFFQRSSWSPDELKKLKKLAMKYRIRLGAYRKRFCKKCFLPLKGSVHVTRNNKSVVCKSCGFTSKFRIMKKE